VVGKLDPPLDWRPGDADEDGRRAAVLLAGKSIQQRRVLMVPNAGCNGPADGRLMPDLTPESVRRQPVPISSGG
jgi:hypothetical protein